MPHDLPPASPAWRASSTLPTSRWFRFQVHQVHGRVPRLFSRCLETSDHGGDNRPGGGGRPSQVHEGRIVPNESQLF
ncbi:hypothetical protein NL676_019847 [Syzygium grande]|nr:hypothetical protein NL676_019847 [Syzygium grande]